MSNIYYQGSSEYTEQVPTPKMGRLRQEEWRDKFGDGIHINAAVVFTVLYCGHSIAAL